MITLYTIITVLVLHFIFDFFFQTDKMAQGKSKNNIDLSVHVSVYAIGVILMGILNYKSFDHCGMVALFIMLNVVCHFFTDYFSSRASSRLWADKEFHDFFGTVGLDQLVHYVTLFGTFVWLSK